ncbi:tyrosine-type recombinase/integrase [Neomicrococcus lactis]|uniref:tyrosine-type recombinase/integrase n=1 Tax=Neomicrococcus lactis TaxID=732241 RepID=UPI0022FFCC02|nr:tyrosine-type recombinase/integrase [Neomicrococcus lactis]
MTEQEQVPTKNKNAPPGMKQKLPPGIEWADNKYRVRVTVNYKTYMVGAFTQLGHAKAALVEARSEIARGVFIPPRERRRLMREGQAPKPVDPRTVTDLLEEWLEHLERQGLKLGTIYTYERHVKANLLPEFGERAAATITPQEMSTWLDALEADKGIKAAAPIHLTVAALFRFAAGDSKELPRNFQPYVLASPVPPVNARRYRRQASQIEVNRAPISAAEIAEIAAGMPPREQLGIMLAGYCALRIGEVLALRRRNITKDSAGYWLTVEKQIQARGSGVREESPKSAAGIRTIPIPPVIVEDVERHLSEYVAAAPSSPLFPRHPGLDEFHNPNTFRKHFNASIAALNDRRAKMNATLPAAERVELIENFTFHGLRHTALTRLGQAGATTAELKAYAGHSDGDSVAKYQHAERSRLVTLASKLGETK